MARRKYHYLKTLLGIKSIVFLGAAIEAIR